ncbi:MAG: hypothetical protein H8D45_11005 [Bacteroidetes bacterium]|nr:hypothetical protein [Bacteroidota bacterium]
MTKKTLQKRYDSLVGEYVDKLTEGTDYVLEYWVCDEIGGVVAISSDVYITFDEIKYCVDNGISIDQYGEYQDWAIEEHFKKPEKEQYRDYVKDKYITSSFMNFKSWLKLRDKGGK